MYFIRVFFLALLAFMFVETSWGSQQQSCDGIPNAVPSECSNLCVNNCRNQACTLACEEGCSCKPNYVYDQPVNRCVLRRNCSNRSRSYAVGK